MKVGFIGLGTMGSSMALNTLKGGMNLSSMILTVMLLRRTSKGGASWADSPRAVAAASDICVRFALTVPPQVEA